MKLSSFLPGFVRNLWYRARGYRTMSSVTLNFLSNLERTMIEISVHEVERWMTEPKFIEVVARNPEEKDALDKLFHWIKRNPEAYWGISLSWSGNQWNGYEEQEQPERNLFRWLISTEEGRKKWA